VRCMMCLRAAEEPGAVVLKGLNPPKPSPRPTSEDAD